MMKEKNKNIKKFVYYIYENNRKKIIMSAMLMLLGTATDLYLPLLIKKIVDKGIVEKNLSTLLRFALIYLIIQLLSNIIEFILSYIYSIMRNSTAIKLRVKILKHISLLSGKYYTNKKTGNILSIVQSDVDTIESIDAELAFSLIKNFITAIAALYFMFRIQYDLFLIVVILQIVLILLQKIFTKMIHENVSLIRKEYGEITHLIQEYVLNIMSIVISKSRRFFISNYINKDRKIVNRSIKTDMLYKGNMAVAITINSIISMILYGYGGYKIINGNLTLGSLLAFQSYSAMLLGPCMSIINANNRIQQAKVSIDRVYSPLDEKSEIYCKDRTIKIILLLRLWDVDKGEIYINKINLKEYNLNSLRKNISVVTQDSLVIKYVIFQNSPQGRYSVSNWRLNLGSTEISIDNI